MRQSLIKSTQVITNAFISTVSAVPVFLIAKKAAQDGLGIPPLAWLNGIICMALTVPLTFNFIDQDIDSIHTQWEMADAAGKSLILGSYIAAFPAGGLLNTYYMTGNAAFKVISLLVPCFFPRALMTEWPLRARLAIKPQYKNTHVAYRLLRLFLLNLQFNKTLAEKFDTDDYQELAKTIKNTDNDVTCLADVTRQLHDLCRQKDTALIMTDLQIKHPKYGACFSGLKLITFIALGTTTSVFTYWGLAWTGAACVFGSRLAHDFGDVSCTIVDTVGENYGRFLGYLTFGQLTLTTIFPMIALVDVLNASRKNKYDRNRSCTYLAALIGAGCRVSVIVYLVNANNGNLASLGYTALTWFIYNFFSGVALAPPMFKTIYKTIKTTSNSLWQSCRNYWRGHVEETTELLEPPPTISSTIGYTKKLLSLCLFRPDKTESALSVASTNTKIDITYT